MTIGKYGCRVQPRISGPDPSFRGVGRFDQQLVGDAGQGERFLLVDHEGPVARQGGLLVTFDAGHLPVGGEEVGFWIDEEPRLVQGIFALQRPVQIGGILPEERPEREGGEPGDLRLAVAVQA